MKLSSPPRRRFLAGAAGLTGLGTALVITSGCASLDTPTQAPAAADVLAVRQPRVGDRWRYARINLYNKDIIGEERVQRRLRALPGRERKGPERKEGAR
jgi:hypothetical protein